MNGSRNGNNVPKLIDFCIPRPWMCAINWIVNDVYDVNKISPKSKKKNAFSRQSVDRQLRISIFLGFEDCDSCTFSSLCCVWKRGINRGYGAFQFFVCSIRNIHIQNKTVSVLFDFVLTFFYSPSTERREKKKQKQRTSKCCRHKYTKIFYRWKDVEEDDEKNMCINGAPK